MDAPVNLQYPQWIITCLAVTLEKLFNEKKRHYIKSQIPALKPVTMLPGKHQRSKIRCTDTYRYFTSSTNLNLKCDRGMVIVDEVM